MRSSWERDGAGLTSRAVDGSWEVYRQTCKAKAARKAGYIANMFIEVHSALDFVTIPESRVDQINADFWRVGIWEPSGSDDTGTIFADEDMVDFAQPLLKVIGQVQADVPMARHARYASFFEMAPHEVLDYHRDGVDRVITGLMGSSAIYLQNQQGRIGILPFVLDPGDTYTMRVDQPATGQTPLHAVENGPDLRLTMMLA